MRSRRSEMWNPSRNDSFVGFFRWIYSFVHFNIKLRETIYNMYNHAARVYFLPETQMALVWQFQQVSCEGQSTNELMPMILFQRLQQPPQPTLRVFCWNSFDQIGPTWTLKARARLAWSFGHTDTHFKDSLFLQGKKAEIVQNTDLLWSWG